MAILTWRALAVVNKPAGIVEAAKVAALKILRVDIAAPGVRDRHLEHGSNALVKFRDFRFGEPACWFHGIETRREHCFGGVDIAEAADLCLVKQKFLERAF